MLKQNFDVLRQRRQSQICFNLKFRVPLQPDEQNLDRWLGDVLGLVLPDPVERSAVDLDQVARQWLQRCLLLSRELMQLGRMPVFDAAQIVSCTQGEEKLDGLTSWMTIVSVPLIDNVKVAAYTIAFNASFRLCRLMASRPVTEENCQNLFSSIEKQVVAQLCRMITAGKSTIPLLRTAHNLAIPFVHLGAGVYQLGWGVNSRSFDRSTSENDSAIGMKLSHNKAVCARLLSQAGLPAPEHEIVTNVNEAKNVMTRLRWPVVTKPVDLDRGEGVSVDIADQTSLEEGYARAQKASGSDRVLVERQVSGFCHRLLIVEDQLLYVIKRMPVAIVADGVHCIAELVARIAAEQRCLPPWKRADLVPFDDLARAAIATAGYDESSIPAAGVNIPLRRIESTQWGGTYVDVTEQIHPENVKAAVAATSLFRLQVAGIDIITPDISKPWYENGAIINEVNYAPHMGGNALSRQYLPQYLKQLVPHLGRIPAELFVGGTNAWTEAHRRWQQLNAKGVATYLTRGDNTLSPDGSALHLSVAGAYHRTRALLLRRDAAAIVVVAQQGEFDAPGEPVDFTQRTVCLSQPRG